MTAWGGGPPGQDPSAPPPAGRTPEKRRVAVPIAMFVAAVLVIGLGAFLLASRRSSDTVGGAAGVAGSASSADDATSIATPVTAAESAAPDPARTTAVDATSDSASNTDDADVADNSDAARADLELHFANHTRRDLDAAYAGLTASFAPDFDEFVQFWDVEVATVDSPIDSCDVTGERGVCAVRFFITFSDAANEDVRNRCQGQSVELTMQRTDGRFLIDEQRDLGPLDCPTP